MNATNPDVVSVVIPTFNRLELLRDLLDDLALQQLAPGVAIEVVVVDDESVVPVAPKLTGHGLGPKLQVIAQRNAGPGAARHRAIEASRGSIIVCLDDDMRVDPQFVNQHLMAHREGADVVLGRIVDANDGARRPLFHRLHQRYLDAKVDGGGRRPARGVELFTGNVSFRTDKYVEVGGFDVTLRRSEDRDLGIRFEHAGCRLVSDPSAVARHRSDHQEVASWRRRSMEWGALDQAIAERMKNATSSPWQVLRQMPSAFGPVALAAALWPRPLAPVAGVAYRLGCALDRGGLQGPAMQAAALTYGIDYFRGVGGATPRRRDLLRAFRKAANAGQRSGPESAPQAPSGTSALPPGGPFKRFAHAVAADHAVGRLYRARYQGVQASAWRLPFDAVTKVGFQMLILARVMRLLGDLRVPGGPQVVSRLIRHLHGAEIHWKAHLAPGICFVHGNGLVISADASVGERCILFQNVTLGRSLDAARGVSGAPTLHANVHVGPGAVLLGPIEIGEGTKVVANSVVTMDVPAGVVVRPPPVEFAVPRLLRAVNDLAKAGECRGGSASCTAAKAQAEVR